MRCSASSAFLSCPKDFLLTTTTKERERESEKRESWNNPRLSIVACQWTTGSQTNILFDASSNDVALSLNGNGAYNTGSQSMPSIPNPASSGVTGDILLTNGSASVGTIWLKLRKTSGYANLA